MRLVVLSCLGLSFVAGCGGGASAIGAGAAASGGRGASSEARYAAPKYGKMGPVDRGGYAEPSVVESEPAPPPASARSDRDEERSDAPTPAPEDRPGLGTEFGETRESRVHDVSFTRANGDHPLAIASMFYDDRAGVDALARLHGGSFAAPRAYSARGGDITVVLLDGDGHPLDAMRVGDRTYIVGEAGERYSVVLTNHTAHRFEAVATVDGLDVVNGHPGDFSNRGYVLSPFATLEIDGFRRSEDAVAAFRFAKVSESYAARTGDARNVGVIGVALFGEEGDDDDEARRRDRADPFPGSDPRYAQPPR